MEKEKLTESSRAKVAFAGLIAELLILTANHYGLDVPPELLNTVAVSIAGIIGSFIVGRSIRNTPTDK